MDSTGEHGFGARLRAAMLAAGLTAPEQLGAMCGISARTAARYMVLEEADLSAKTAEKMARALRVRLGWLVTGLPPIAHRQEAVEALIILERLSPTKARRWIAAGRRMAETE